MRAAIYARVSSAGQRDRHTIESQLRTLPAFVAERGWTLAGTYVDDGRSAKAGELEKRDGFARLMLDAAAGAFAVVAVVEIDRLTRTEDMTERGLVLGAFQRAGVKIAVASSGQVLDLSSFMGDFWTSLQAVFAAEDNRKRAERVTQGRQTAIARGRKPAGRTPYGWDYDRKTGQWQVNEVAGPIIREIYARIIRGESTVSVASDLEQRTGEAWHHGRVHRIVFRATYRGEWAADKARGLLVRVPAIVDDVTWQRARDVMASRHRNTGGLRTKHAYLLEGLAVCSLCSAVIGINSQSRDGDRIHPATYVCKHRRRPPRGHDRCALPYWRTAEADERVWSGLRRLLLRADLLDEAMARVADMQDDGWAEDLAGYESQLAKSIKAESAILARFRRGIVSEQAMDAELTAQAKHRAMLERQIATARQAAAGARQRAAGRMELAEAIRTVQGNLEAVDAKERRELVCRMIAPGAIAIGSERISGTVRLSRGLVARSGCREPSETIATFRLVA